MAILYLIGGEAVELDSERPMSADGRYLTAIRDETAREP
jgi:hypothetical protein